MEWLFWWLSPFTLWGIICTGVITYSYINEHREKVEPKSETLLFLDRQNEWSKQLTLDRRRRDKDRSNEHHDWTTQAREIYKRSRKWGYIPNDEVYNSLLEMEHAAMQSFSNSWYEKAWTEARKEADKRVAFERKFLIWMGLSVDK